jgi:hypothetical protein
LENAAGDVDSLICLTEKISGKMNVLIVVSLSGGAVRGIEVFSAVGGWRS